MIDGQSEQLNSIKKAMKIHQIVSSDKKDFQDCKKDLMTKVAMDESEAAEVASAIRDLFMPKLLESEGISGSELPKEFSVKMTADDDGFVDEDEYEDQEDDGFDFGDEDEDLDADDESLDSEKDVPFDDNEVDDDEIATIHIKVPANKIRAVEEALENVLGDTDAQSQDHANVHKDKETQGDNMDKQTFARKELRKTILAAMQEDKEVQSVSRDSKFDYANSEQYQEESFYDTFKGNLTDPDFDTLDYNEQDIPNFTDLIDHIGTDLGLNESLTPTKFDGVPPDREEYSLEFNAFEIPSQGNEDLYGEMKIPSEGKLPLKRTVNSSVLGDFNADDAELVLAHALKTAGVEDEDLGKLTYAEGLELFKAIRTASEMKERHSYSPEGKMNFPQNDKIKDPDKKGERSATTEQELRDHTGTEEQDPEKDHEREGKELYSKSQDKKDAYAQMLQKLMKVSVQEDEEDEEHKGNEDDSSMDEKMKNLREKKSETKVELKGDDTKFEVQASTELFKARLKTAYAMSNKLALAGLLPANEVDTYAEGMLSDGLSVNAMMRQTKLHIDMAAANAERFAATSDAKSIRTASAGVSFNPSMKSGVDLGGPQDIQQALRGYWTAPKVGTED
jgi:hypothetical protein